MTGTFFVNLFGWAGSAAVVTAYALVSTNRLQSNSTVYQALNLFGGLSLVANTIYYRAYPSAFVNVVWSLIAILALLGMGDSFRNKRKESDSSRD